MATAATIVSSGTCTNDHCGCHIGYVHLEELHLDRVYGEGLLERIPRR